MRDFGRRPMGRLCYWALVVACLPAYAQSGPATTTVADTVYAADGSYAQGNLIISWPPFITAGGARISVPGLLTCAIEAGLMWSG